MIPILCKSKRSQYILYGNVITYDSQTLGCAEVINSNYKILGFPLGKNKDLIDKNTISAWKFNNIYENLSSIKLNQV